MVTPRATVEVTDDQLLVHGPGQTIAVVGLPWRLARTDHEGTPLVLRDPPPTPELVHLPDGIDIAVRTAMNPQAARTLVAIQLAGTAVAALAEGISLAEAWITAEGTAAFRLDLPMLDNERSAVSSIPAYIVALLAFHVAGSRHLAASTVDEPYAALQPYLNASFMLPQLLSVDAGRPLALLFGDATAPEGWDGETLSVENLQERARTHIDIYANEMNQFARNLAEHSRADRAELSGLRSSMNDVPAERHKLHSSQ